MDESDVNILISKIEHLINLTHDDRAATVLVALHLESVEHRLGNALDALNANVSKLTSTVAEAVEHLWVNAVSNLYIAHPGDQELAETIVMANDLRSGFRETEDA